MISKLNPDFTGTPASRKLTFEYRAEKDKATNPEISIITPFFNTSDIFWETFHCITNQSFQNFEWIIIDDCSSNLESVKILKQAAAKDERIKILKNNSNLGPGGSRNHGIDKAQGNFLFFVDSDDLVEFTMIEKCWIFLKVNREFSFCNSWHIGFGAENYLWRKGFEIGRGLLYENVIQPTFLARKEMFATVKFDETIKDGFEDWDFWLRCAKAGFWGYTINEFLYWYRRTPNVVQKWSTWDFGDKMKTFTDSLKTKYENDLKLNFPQPNIENFGKGILVARKFEKYLNVNKLARTGKKRLVVFIPWMSMGGADKFNLDLIRGLVTKGWEITIIATQRSENNWYSEFAKYTQDIFILHSYCHEAYFPSVIEYVIASRSPNSILITNSEYGYHLLPFLKLAFPSIPVADYNHMEESYWNNGGHPRQGVIYQPHIQTNIVSSQHLKNWMISENAKEEKIEVVTTNSDYTKNRPSTEIRKKLREKFGVDDELCIITFSGRLTDQKQPRVLIRTVMELSKLIPDGYVLVIAGDGPDMQETIALMNTYGLSGKVWFLGEISNADTIELLQASDIYFLPSLWEGISLGIYEAMTIGLPIVGANVGGQIELVTPQTGYLINRADEATESLNYAKILAELIKNPELRKKMGSNGRDRIEKKFSIDQMWDKMDRILTRLKSESGEQLPENLLSTLPQLYALMMHEKKFAEHLWHDMLTLKKQKETLGSQENFATSVMDQVGGFKDQVSEVRNWYHKEYEVLPLWYKRIGHLIKVFQGHRSFTSLISKNGRNK